MLPQKLKDMVKTIQIDILLIWAGALFFCFLAWRGFVATVTK